MGLPKQPILLSMNILYQVMHSLDFIPMILAYATLLGLYIQSRNCFHLQIHSN